MDIAKLKLYAELLEDEIRKHLEESKDIQFLANYEPLIRAIADAKLGHIHEPCEIDGGGLSYWMFEQATDLHNFENLTHRLAQFNLLLSGLEQ